MKLFILLTANSFFRVAHITGRIETEKKYSEKFFSLFPTSMNSCCALCIGVLGMYRKSLHTGMRTMCTLDGRLCKICLNLFPPIHFPQERLRTMSSIHLAKLSVCNLLSRTIETVIASYQSQKSPPLGTIKK